MHRSILRLAIPSILANITVPLVGIVDVAIAGHISDASAIGGIAVGAMLFDLLYWNFGFLRVGTGGMTAQAFGRRDHHAMTDIFTENMSIALCGALLVWLVGWLFVDLVMWCMPSSPEVELFARQYLNIRIWAAPATLTLMVFKGWFIGAQDTVTVALAFGRRIPDLEAVHPVVAGNAAKGRKAASRYVFGGESQPHLCDSSYAILFRALM